MAPLIAPPNPNRGRTILLAVGAALCVVTLVMLALAGMPHPTAAQGEEIPSQWIRGYARFGAIQGESMDDNHQGWCEILAFDQAALNAAGGGGRGGAAASKVQFEDVLITKYLDKAGPLLQEAVAKGTIIPEVTLELETNDEQGTIYYRYELGNATLTHYNIGTSGQRELTPGGLPRFETGSLALYASRPVEEVAVSFVTIKVWYRAQEPDGSFGPWVFFGWDRAGNTSLPYEPPYAMGE